MHDKERSDGIFFFFFLPRSLFIFQLLPTFSCGALLHDQRNTRLVAASVGRRGARDTGTSSHLIALECYFILFFFYWAGGTLPTMALLKHTSLPLFSYEGRASMFVTFGTKDGSIKKKKHPAGSKSTFFSTPFRKRSRLTHQDAEMSSVSRCSVSFIEALSQ